MTSNLLTGWMKRVGDRDSIVHKIVVILQYWNYQKNTIIYICDTYRNSFSLLVIDWWARATPLAGRHVGIHWGTLTRAMTIFSRLVQSQIISRERVNEMSFFGRENEDKIAQRVRVFDSYEIHGVTLMRAIVVSPVYLHLLAWLTSDHRGKKPADMAGQRGEAGREGKDPEMQHFIANTAKNDLLASILSYPLTLWDMTIQMSKMSSKGSTKNVPFGRL